METRYLPAVLVILPGFVGLIPISDEGEAWTAASTMIPAVTVVVTRTLVGLQHVKPIEKIEKSPDKLAIDGVIMPQIFLEGSPYGISRLIYIPDDMLRGNKDN